MRRIGIGSSAILAGALLVSGPLAIGVAAQDASEAPEMTDEMAVECSFEPRVLDELMALFGEVAPSGAGEAASLERNDAALDQAAGGEMMALPMGEPADDDTSATAHATVKGLIACFNAGDLLAGWGGVTDEFLTSQMDLSVFDEDFVAQIEAGPVALAEELQTQLVELGDALLLEDGRVGVLVTYQGPASPGEGIDGLETDLFIVRDVDGTWQLDEVIENLESQYGPAAESMSAEASPAA